MSQSMSYGWINLFEKPSVWMACDGGQHCFGMHHRGALSQVPHFLALL